MEQVVWWAHKHHREVNPDGEPYEGGSLDVKLRSSMHCGGPEAEVGNLQPDGRLAQLEGKGSQTDPGAIE
jgi:hypothetical protein